MVMAMFIRTAKFLWLATGHLQTADNSTQFLTKVNNDPECQSRSGRILHFSFGSRA